jgi:hypothetical protein
MKTKTISKPYHPAVWVAFAIILACLIFAAFVRVAAPDLVTPVTKPPVANVGPLPLFAGGTTAATAADEAIKINFVAGFHRGDDVDPEDAFKVAMYSSGFHTVAPVNPETGQPQHGYFARSITDAFDFVSQPFSDPEKTWKNATELHMYWSGGALHGNFGNEVHEYRFDQLQEGQISRTVLMNVVFDLPHGGHKYMQAVGYEATDGGVVIDDSVMPLMLANIMTSQYMHIYIPSYDQGGKTELVFWTDSFKDLLGPDDRRQAEAAQAKADAETPVTYDDQEKQDASPQTAGVGSH